MTRRDGAINPTAITIAAMKFNRNSVPIVGTVEYLSTECYSMWATPVAKTANAPRERTVTKEIRLNAFDMNCVVHQSAGLWTHPRDHAVDYTGLEYWTELAQILERGCFDGIERYASDGDSSKVALDQRTGLICTYARYTNHRGDRLRRRRGQ